MAMRISPDSLESTIELITGHEHVYNEIRNFILEKKKKTLSFVEARFETFRIL